MNYDKTYIITGPKGTCFVGVLRRPPPGCCNTILECKKIFNEAPKNEHEYIPATYECLLPDWKWESAPFYNNLINAPNL